MLCLQRKENEVIRLYTTDGLIEISFTSIRNGQAKVCINAPRTINVVRAEIDERENQ